MNISSISANKDKPLSEYNSLTNFYAKPAEETTVTKPETEPVKKVDKSMGIETLTIFPKQVVDGKTIITA